MTHQIHQILIQLSISTIKYKNAYFQQYPDENSLGKLKDYVNTLKEEVVSIDSDIREAVKQQSTAGKEAEDELDNAKGAIKALCEKINEIHKKANDSEVMVEDICKYFINYYIEILKNQILQKNI